MRRVSSATWKRLTLFLVLLGLAAFLFIMPSRFTAPARVLFNEAAGPVETGAFQAGGKALAASGTLAETFLKKDRERALAVEVERLRNENAALADQARRLSLKLDSVQKLALQDAAFRAVSAPVSSYDASAVRRSITARAGSSDGVARGMAAAAYGALVGIVTEAGPHECRIRLITDPASAVACRVSRTRALCILQGTGGEDCRVDWLDRESVVEKGDLLVTTMLEPAPGGELLVPDGLPAATVLSVEGDRMRPLFLSVEAAPCVNLERLEGVEIVVAEQAP